MWTLRAGCRYKWNRGFGTGLSVEGSLSIGNFNGNPVATFFCEKQLSG
jgi:hypothetical protein